MNGRISQRATTKYHIRTPKPLRESGDYYRLMVENIVDYAIISLDAEGYIRSWNPGASRIKGYRADEILGQHFSRLYLAADIQAARPQHALAIAAAQGRFEDEGWRLRKDQSAFWANIVITAIRDRNGHLCGFVKLTRDLSQRRQEEDALRQAKEGLERRIDERARELMAVNQALSKSEARFRTVVERAPNAMIMINARGQMEMINAHTELLFGYPRQELLGQPIEMLVPARFRHHHPGLRATFFGNPQPRPMGAGRDLYGLRKDGSEFPVEIGLNPIETEEGPMVLSAILDLSDRKQKENNIRQALKEKDVLLAEIHHRVKNNLQIISSLLHMQSARIVDRDALDLLASSQNRIKSMALIHQTLYQSNDFSHVDFALFLDTLIPNLTSSYGADLSRITIDVDATQALFPLNTAIPCGLIVNELIANALKYAFPDNRCGKIAISMAKDADQNVTLILSDDGIGIPADLDLELSAALGLKLVNLLTDQLGGTVEMRRADPTRFTFRFPLHR
ncbi:MAG: PAS domain S-box protein [Azospirillaceae bacterium]|nr:PAS domain S-box protein [Azospirillaceae bacterium]